MNPYIGPYSNPMLDEEMERIRRLSAQAGVTPQQLQQGTRESLTQRASQDFTGQEGAIENQRAYANMLRGRAAPQGREVGPLGVYVAPNWGEQVRYAGEQALGGYLSGRADRADKALDEQRGLAKAAGRDLEQMDVQEQRDFQKTLADDAQRARADLQTQAQEFDAEEAAKTRADNWKQFQAKMNLTEQELALERQKHFAKATKRGQATYHDPEDPSKTITYNVDEEGNHFLNDEMVPQSVWQAQMPFSAGAAGSTTAAQAQGEYRADLFQSALDDMDNLLDERGYDPTTLGALKDKITNASDLTRWLSSAEGQQYQAAATTLKEQALRTATGAAAPKSENQEYVNTLIPGPFDDKATVEFKRNRLRDINSSLRRIAGKDATQEELNAAADKVIEEMREKDAKASAPSGPSSGASRGGRGGGRSKAAGDQFDDLWNS